jgi:uncharacterized damage-inducible protein DinB
LRYTAMRDSRRWVVLTMLLAALEEAYERQSWHGPNLRGSIRGVTAEQAARRPAAGRHNIHELVVHAAYWKYAVRRSLTGGKRGSFEYKGSNWFVRDDLDEPLWRADVALLAAEHRLLFEAVATFDPARLDDLTPKKKFTYAGLIRGAAAHDLYHAGQIQLLKRLV